MFKVGYLNRLGGSSFLRKKICQFNNWVLSKFVALYFQMLCSDLLALVLFQRQTSLLPFKTCGWYSSEAGKHINHR